MSKDKTCEAFECKKKAREKSAFCSDTCRSDERKFMEVQAIAGNSHAFEAGIPGAQVE